MLEFVRLLIGCFLHRALLQSKPKVVAGHAAMFSQQKDCSTMEPAPCPEYPTFLEKLALALAMGPNPKKPDETEHEHRSRIAKTANELMTAMGGKSKMGRTPNQDLEIFFVAFRCDEGRGRIIPTPGFGPPPPGYGDLAASNALRETEDEDLGPGVPSTALDTRLKVAAKSMNLTLQPADLPRLRNKWRKTGRNGKGDEATQDPYRRYLVTLESIYEHEKKMLDNLLAIQALLAPWGIPMEVDVIRLRMASLWTIVP